MVKKCVVLAILMVFATGCGSDVATGIGVGVAGMTTSAEAQKLAKESKIALSNEIVLLRSQLDSVEVLDEKWALLQDELASKERQLITVANTELVLTKALEAASKDWTSKESMPSNIRWVVDALLVLAAGWQTRKLNVVNHGVSKFSAESEPGIAKKLYDDTKKYGKTVLG